MNVPKDIQENFDQQICGMLPFDWNLAADSFYIGESRAYRMNDGSFGREIYIHKAIQRDGTVLWKVLMDNTWALAKSLTQGTKYVYEPIPSSRTDEYLHNTRFPSKEEALRVLVQHEQKCIANPNFKPDLHIDMEDHRKKRK